MPCGFKYKKTVKTISALYNKNKQLILIKKITKSTLKSQIITTFALLNITHEHTRYS